MPHDDDADEDWYDDGDDPDDDDDSVRCPECGSLISGFTDKCAACGYWLLDSDRRNSGSHGSRPNWVTLTAVMLLLVFLVSLLWW